MGRGACPGWGRGRARRQPSGRAQRLCPEKRRSPCARGAVPPARFLPSNGRASRSCRPQRRPARTAGAHHEAAQHVEEGAADHAEAQGGQVRAGRRVGQCLSSFCILWAAWAISGFGGVTCNRLRVAGCGCGRQHVPAATAALVHPAPSSVEGGLTPAAVAPPARRAPCSPSTPARQAARRRSFRPPARGPAGSKQSRCRRPPAGRGKPRGAKRLKTPPPHPPCGRGCSRSNGKP